MKAKYILAIATIVFTVAIVAANPNILTYNGQFWFNDRNEQVDVSVVQDYTTVSTNPWIIEVTNPQLQYQSTPITTYQNGEIIEIQVTGFGTMTLTANQPITISVY